MSEWLAGEFALLGVHFQNWMPLALTIIVSWMVFLWWKGSFDSR
jgi:hypothetical protein